MDRSLFPKDATQARLLAQLADPSPKVRRGAAYILGTKGGAAAVAPLVALLADDSADVRRWVADALGRLGDAGAIPALETAARADPDPEVRTWAVTALGRLAKSVNETVVTALTDSDPTVQAAAAFALETIGDANALPALETWLQNAAQTEAHYKRDLYHRLQAPPPTDTAPVIAERDARYGQSTAMQAVTKAIAALKATIS